MKLPDRIPPKFAAGLIAPKLAIVAGLLVCVASLLFLTPSRSELFKRHMADGDARAASLLLALQEAGNTDETAAALTAETIRICQRDGWKASSLDMLTSFLRNNENFGSAAKEASRHLDQMPPAARSAVLGVLVTRALGDGEVARAQELQMRLVESADPLTPEIVRQAVTTYRFNSNAALALVTIDQLEKQRGSLPTDLLELRVVLARETSQPEMAFALLAQQVRATTDLATLRTLIPKAVKVGIEAGRQNELIPLYERYLEIVKATGGESGPLITEYSLKLAQTYEWTKQPSKAFDVYIVLAAEGNRAALDRCLALNPGLFRQEDVMNALVAGYDHYREDDKLLFLAARYLGESARREEAIRYYRLYLDRNPKDAEGHFRLGAVYDEDLQLEEALKSYRRAFELAPENNTYLAKLARLAVTLRHYDEALPYLRTLSHRTKGRDEVEEYYTLADGLGDLEGTKEALRLMIDIGGRLTANNYVYLAAVYREEGDLQGHLSCLKEGVKKYPANAFLRLDLANAHLYERRPDLALRVLKGVDLASHPQGAETAVNAFVSLESTPYARYGSTFLAQFGAQIENSEDLSPLEALQFAEYCKKRGSTTRARRLFHRVIKEAREAGVLARAHYHLGQFRQARDYQRKHIQGPARLTSEDYQLLGDIHTRLGEGASARNAYQKALSLLEKRTATTPRR